MIQGWVDTCPNFSVQPHNPSSKSQFIALGGCTAGRVGFPYVRCYIGENGASGYGIPGVVSNGWVSSEYPTNPALPGTGGIHFITVVTANTHFIGCASGTVK